MSKAEIRDCGAFDDGRNLEIRDCGAFVAGAI